MAAMQEPSLTGSSLHEYDLLPTSLPIIPLTARVADAHALKLALVGDVWSVQARYFSAVPGSSRRYIYIKRECFYFDNPDTPNTNVWKLGRDGWR